MPQLIAAALIAKNPKKYVFNHIFYTHPWAYEWIKVPGDTDLRWFAEELEIPAKELFELNPEIKAGKTPSGTKGYRLKVPTAKKAEAGRLARLADGANGCLGKFLINYL